jgi:hypothetical protein
MSGVLILSSGYLMVLGATQTAFAAASSFKKGVSGSKVLPSVIEACDECLPPVQSVDYLQCIVGDFKLLLGCHSVGGIWNLDMVVLRQAQ